MDVAAAIAMSVGAYKAQLLFHKMKGEPTATPRDGGAEATHPAGAT